MMHRLKIMLLGIVVGCHAMAGVSFAEGFFGLNTLSMIKKVRAASRLIEKKGDAAFVEFKENKDEWLGDKWAIFVVNATVGHEDEGMFVLYPDVTPAGGKALYMPLVNGRGLVEEARKMERKGKWVWFGYMESSYRKDLVPYAGAWAVAPDGSDYAIAASMNNMEQGKEFLRDLVGSACDLFQAKGEGAFTAFNDPKSKFRFHNTYVFVLDRDATILCDPGNPDAVGKKLTDLPHATRGIGATMQEALSSFDSARVPLSSQQFADRVREIFLTNEFVWDAYLIPLPGETELSYKVSCFKRVTGPDGKVYAVGSGVYLAGK